MADVQIVRSAIADVPAVYTVPGAAEFTLKAVYAFFDGSGTGTDWIPAVTILSDSGHTVTFAADQSQLVVGGDDAEVSWFPGVKAGGGAAARGLDILAMVQRTPAQSIPNTTATLVEFGPVAGTTFYTNAPDDWTFDTTGAGDITAVHCEKPGLYLVHAHLTWGAVAGNYTKKLDLLVGSLVPQPPLTVTTTDITFDTATVDNESNYVFAVDGASVGAANNAIRVSCFQNSGGAVAIDSAILMVTRIATSFS